MKILIGFLFLLSSVTSFAQQGQRDGKGNGCRQEVMQICGQNRGNPEQMKACIAQNRAQFSEQCQQQVGQGKRRGKRD